jgi:hypothetical protein
VPSYSPPAAARTLRQRGHRLPRAAATRIKQLRYTPDNDPAGWRTCKELAKIHGNGVANLEYLNEAAALTKRSRNAQLGSDLATFTALAMTSHYGRKDNHQAAQLGRHINAMCEQDYGVAVREEGT